MCIEMIPKQLTEHDCIISKYNPVHILKYPININQEEVIKKGYIVLKSDEFKHLLNKNDIQNLYITKSTYESNDIVNIKKIRIQSDCNQSNCDILQKLPDYKKLYLKLNTKCNGTDCKFATLSINNL